MGERPWVDASRGGSPRPDHPRWIDRASVDVSTLGCRHDRRRVHGNARTTERTYRLGEARAGRHDVVDDDQTVPGDGGVAPRRSRWAPARFAARPAPDSPAWSASRRLATSSGATVARRCARIEVAACFAMRSNGSWPRCRVARRREGTGTRSTGPYVVPTAADTEAASATPRGRARASRPCSLCARSIARTGPSYDVTAKVVGKPGGHGLGRACAGCADSTAAQPRTQQIAVPVTACAAARQHQVDQRADHTERGERHRPPRVATLPRTGQRRARRAEQIRGAGGLARRAVDDPGQPG